MATDLGYLLLLGFGSYKLTELYKEILRRIGLHQVAWWKSFINLIVCAVLALLVTHRSVEIRVLLAVGAAGVAALLHAVDTVLRSHRDDMISQVMEKSRYRRR
jgi:hypothetical protein